MEHLSLNRWASPWLRNQHLARYRWASSFARAGRVIDAACGSGYGARILIENGAHLVDGIDKSIEAIEEARQGADGGLHFFVADATELPLPESAYDVYVSFETIEHVDDDRALVAEARRVLKSDGLFICSTPNRLVVSPGHDFSARPANPYHVREYVVSELESILRTHFCSVDLFCQTSFPFVYIGCLNRIGRSFPKLATRIHQMRKVLRVPWETADRYDPAQMSQVGVPEVLIAVCRA